MLHWNHQRFINVYIPRLKSLQQSKYEKEAEKQKATRSVVDSNRIFLQTSNFPPLVHFSTQPRSNLWVSQRTLILRTKFWQESKREMSGPRRASWKDGETSSKEVIETFSFRVPSIHILRLKRCTRLCIGRLAISHCLGHTVLFHAPN